MVADYLKSWAMAWNQFWFRPADPTILGLMRILVGLMVFYTHLVWTKELQTFYGAEGVIPATFRDLIYGEPNWVWSHFDWISSGSWLWTVHVIGLIIIGMFAAGLFTRVTSVLTCLLAISYANRATGALFGLDQINCFLCLYLALGTSGACFSVDQWIRRRSSDKIMGEGGAVRPSISNFPARDTLSNIAIRLIQVHMCVVYFFAGVGKLQGDTWWNGTAIWYALASYEYQTLDMTWLAGHLWLVNLMTLIALAWEVCFAFLIWPRLTRPIFLLLAVTVHLGIGIAMGMLTFGLIMIIGNLAFVPIEWIRRTLRLPIRSTESNAVVAQS